MELYPGIVCKILYQRDYLNLLVKYGLEQPSQGALLGTGQAEQNNRPSSIEEMLSNPSAGG